MGGGAFYILWLIFSIKKCVWVEFSPIVKDRESKSITVNYAWQESAHGKD